MQSQRQDRRGDDEADAGIGRPPADERHRQAHQQRPDRAREVIAGRHNDHREPAPLDEPVRNIRHHRPEAGPRADADQHVGRRKHEEVGRVTRQNEAYAKARAADRQGNGDAAAIRHSPQRDRREGERAHHHGVRQRGGRAVDAEFKLRLRQDDDHRPHARPDQRRDHAATRRGGQTRSGRQGHSGWRIRGHAWKSVHCPDLRHTDGDSNRAMSRTAESRRALDDCVNLAKNG